jgi:hypothetical protein
LTLPGRKSTLSGRKLISRRYPQGKNQGGKSGSIELKRVKPPAKVSEEQLAELKALAKMTDEQSDLSDIPEITDWSGAGV